MSATRRPTATAAAAAAAAAAPAAPPPPPPTPELRKSFVAGKVSGTIRVKGKNGRFRTLGANESIPLGSEVDATKGKVRITSAADAAGKTQSALFFHGAFVITQTKGSKPVTQLALSSKLSCTSTRKGRASQSARKRKVRRLWGDGKGRFRTKGRHGAATVRGTKWLTQDSCEKHARAGQARHGRGRGLRQAEDRAGQAGQVLRGPPQEEAVEQEALPFVAYRFA